MGYSLSVQAPSEELQKKMYEFLCDNWDYIHDHEEFKIEASPVSALRICYGRDSKTGISYAPDDVPHLVGFDYSSWITEPERVHVYRVVDWMRDVFDSDAYYYDDERVDEPIKTKEAVTQYMQRSLIALLGGQLHLRKVIDFVFKDVDRLNRLWEVQ